MDYHKLSLSFIFLLAMCLIQFLTAVFLIHHRLIAVLSVIAFIFCLLGLIYANKKSQ